VCQARSLASAVIERHHFSTPRRTGYIEPPQHEDEITIRGSDLTSRYASFIFGVGAA